MSKGQYAVVSPELTGLTEDVRGEVINVRQNPFLGQEIAVRDANGRIYFGDLSILLQFDKLKTGLTLLNL